MQTIQPRPLGRAEKWADKALEPLMRILMEVNGTPGDSPQRTHRWNNSRLSITDTELLVRSCMVESKGDPKAWPLPSLFRHLPLIGWQRYVVIGPPTDRPWHIGWVWDKGAGISLLTHRTPVRMLEGPGRVLFFGLCARTHRQIPIRQMGQEKLGSKSDDRLLPLL